MSKPSIGTHHAKATGTADASGRVLPPHSAPLAPQTALKDAFSASEIEQISKACALFTMVNRLNDDLGLSSDPEDIPRIPWDAGETLTVEDFGDFASRMAKAGVTDHGAPV